MFCVPVGCENKKVFIFDVNVKTRAGIWPVVIGCGQGENMVIIDEFDDFGIYGVGMI
jgi:hypothetical protein